MSGGKKGYEPPSQGGGSKNLYLMKDCKFEVNNPCPVTPWVNGAAGVLGAIAQFDANSKEYQLGKERNSNEYRRDTLIHEVGMAGVKAQERTAELQHAAALYEQDSITEREKQKNELVRKQAIMHNALEEKKIANEKEKNLQEFETKKYELDVSLNKHKESLKNNLELKEKDVKMKIMEHQHEQTIHSMTLQDSLKKMNVTNDYNLATMRETHQAKNEESTKQIQSQILMTQEQTISAAIGQMAAVFCSENASERDKEFMKSLIVNKQLSHSHMLNAFLGTQSPHAK